MDTKPQTSETSIPEADASTSTPENPAPAPTPTPASQPPAADSFVRDPHKLIAYVVPFPAPNPPNSTSTSTSPSPPLRFVLYTPPSPPLLKPDVAAGDARERTTAKIQRNWEEEVRAAHESAAPLLSFKGLRARVTRGVHWAVGQTTSADLDFLTRIPRDGEAVKGHAHGETQRKKEEAEEAAMEQEDKDTPEKTPQKMALDDSGCDSDADGDPATAHSHADALCRTVKLSSMVLIYPPSMKMTEDELRTEFISSLMRTKSKAQRDAVIATGLLPVTAVLDWALVFVGWVFGKHQQRSALLTLGGALEVDAIWMANSFRGAKTARSVTRRLASTEESITLDFVASDRAAVLESYLLGACIARNRPRFNRPHWGIPSEGDVMTTIGWQASQHYQAESWEDETWERDHVVKDLQGTMNKAARGWDKWLDGFVKNPDKALAR
jgi:hypothetical protein